MKASELIRQMSQLMAEHGDCDVFIHVEAHFMEPQTTYMATMHQKPAFWIDEFPLRTEA